MGIMFSILRTATKGRKMFNVGDRVFLIDEAFESHGTVLKIRADGDVIIEFDDGTVAPYSAQYVRSLHV